VELPSAKLLVGAPSPLKVLSAVDVELGEVDRDPEIVLAVLTGRLSVREANADEDPEPEFKLIEELPGDWVELEREFR
jgi:hypothetical protein